MKERLTVSTRGRITLPASIRKRLGLRGGDVLILEERANEIILKPGAVDSIERYNDDQIAAWDQADELGDDERTRLSNKVSARRR